VGLRYGCIRRRIVSPDRLTGWNVHCLSILEALKLHSLYGVRGQLSDKTILHSLYDVHGQLSDKIISMYFLMPCNVKLSDGVIMNKEVGESCSFESLYGNSDTRERG